MRPVDMFKNTILEELVTVKKSLNRKNTEKRKKMTDIFIQLREIPIGPITYDETGNETNDETDTTNMPNLESKKSAEQIRNQKGQGLLKILTPDQMLNGLPITLAQLKVGNNPEKLKNEIRQLLMI